MVGVLNCSTNTYVVKARLMSYKRAPTIGIHVPSSLPRKFWVFQTDDLLWLRGIDLVVVVLQGLAECGMPWRHNNAKTKKHLMPKGNWVQKRALRIRKSLNAWGRRSAVAVKGQIQSIENGTVAWKKKNWNWTALGGKTASLVWASLWMDKK